MENIVIYTDDSNNIEIDISYKEDTFWLSLVQISTLFERDKSVISRHINKIFKEGELNKMATVAKNATVQKEGGRTIERQILYYNLDMVIAIGYRVNSIKGTQFRIWATKKLNDYLVKGYAINEKRLEQKQQEVLHLKTGIQILSRAIEARNETHENEILNIFTNGLELLDDYDHETLDTKGNTEKDTVFPTYDEYLDFIKQMYSDFESDVFAKPKDESFHSSVNQIAQSFGGNELYPSIQEKAANLLYFIVKNHSFVDGNKRIAAACFLYFLDKNNALLTNNKPIIDNEALASLTLFIATSKPEEDKIVKRFIISILNRNMES